MRLYFDCSDIQGPTHLCCSSCVSEVVDEYSFLEVERGNYILRYCCQVKDPEIELDKIIEDYKAKQNVQI